MPNYLITARPDLDDSWAIFWRESQIDNNETSGSVQVPCPRPLPRLCPRARPASPRAWFLQLQVSLKCHIFCVIVFPRPPGHHVFIISVYGNQPFQEETNSEHSQDQDIPVLLYCSCHSAEGSWQRSWCLVSVMVQGQWVS